MDKKTKAWLIALSGTFITATVYATVVNCFAVLIIPICNEFGFSRGGYNFGLTLLYITYTIGSIMSGKVYQRISLKTLLEASAVALPLLYVLLSYASSLAAFYILYMAIGFFLPFISFSAFSVLIHDWFDGEKSEGTAIGVAFMGSGIGGMLLNVLVARWIETLGYRSAIRIQAVLMAVAAIPVAFFLIKNNHENFGVVRREKKEGAVLFIPGTGRLLFLTFFIGFGITIMSQTIPPHLQDQGYSQMYAAAVNSSFMGALCLSKMLMGVMFDRWGMKKTMAFSVALGIMGAVSYYFGGIQLLHPFMVIGGAWACSLGSVAIPILAKHMCRPEIFASASGNGSAFDMLGSSLAPFFMNVLYDRVGSYNYGYILSVLLFLGVAALVPWRRKSL